MERIGEHDFDLFLLQMEQTFLKEKGSSNKVSVGESQSTSFSKDFSVHIPPEFHKADPAIAKTLFWSKRRPSILYDTADHTAGITFRELEDTKEESLFALRASVKQTLMQIDHRTVFYGQGEENNIYWMEYKSFAAKERLYHLLFLFCTGDTYWMGTCYCTFEGYEEWRPKLLAMLRTIKTKEEEADEGI